MTIGQLLNQYDFTVCAQTRVLRLLDWEPGEEIRTVVEYDSRRDGDIVPSALLGQDITSLNVEGDYLELEYVDCDLF